MAGQPGSLAGLVPDSDAGRVPELARDLPGLAAAFDGGHMGARLRDALGGDELTIESCAPGHATYVDRTCVLLRYRLDVRQRTTIRGALVNARLFGDSSAAAAYVRTDLAPLARRAAAHPAPVRWSRRAASLDDLALAA